MGNVPLAVKSLSEQNRNRSSHHHRLQGVAYSSSRALHNQRVVQRKRVRTPFVKSSSVHNSSAHTLSAQAASSNVVSEHSSHSRNNFTLFSEIFKLKKSRFIVALPILLIIVSAIPLSVAFKSYVWEKQRAFIGNKNLLYDLFMIDEFMVLGEEQYPEAIRSGYTVPTLKTSTYVVRKGDSLYSIAKKHNISVDAILSINNMKDAAILRIGTVLQIPNMNGIQYTVRKGDSLSSITSTYKIDMNKLVDVNELDSSVIQVGQKLFIPGASMSEWERAEALGTLFKYPVRGRLTSRMGFRIDPFTKRRAYHAGIDLANRTGTPVTASQSGKVIYTGYKGNYGKTVILTHQQGYTTLYGHLDKITVKKGQSVKQGQSIGTLGNTGRSTGPHLHFEIRRYRRNIDPLKLLHR